MTDAEKIAYYEDILGIRENQSRYALLRSAYRLPPQAIWMLSRLVAARGNWVPAHVLLDAMPALDPAKERDPSAVKVRASQIRRKLGKEAVENDRDMGYRLSMSAFRVIMHTVLTPAPGVVVTECAPSQIQINEAVVRSILNDPDVLPIDKMQIHGRWRAGGG